LSLSTRDCKQKVIKEKKENKIREIVIVILLGFAMVLESGIINFEEKKKENYRKSNRILFRGLNVLV
jgi:hypothetical protein